MPLAAHKYVLYRLRGMVRRCAAVATSVLLASCASMSPEQCRVADWHQVGLRDGAQGEAPYTRLEAYTQDCAEVGIRPNATAYQYGWQVGVQNFCTPASGWREGLAGNLHKEAACDTLPQAGAFRQALQAGYDQYQLRQQLNENQRNIQRLERRLLDPNVPDWERSNIRLRLFQLDREQIYLRHRRTERWVP